MIEMDGIVAKMKNQKINYDRVLKKMIQQWERSEERPKILLHSCCAPCSTYVLEFLTQYADVAIYFANPNIHPKKEYERRAYVQEAFIKDFNERNGTNVRYIEAPYKPHEFMKMAKERGVTDEPEGGLRCTACFEMRLDMVAEAAVKYGYDYFGSALTLSPKKNAQLINEIGSEVQKLYDVNYLPSDFKKNKGYERSLEMCRDYNIYRQCYCGCVFAAQSQGIDFKEVNKAAQAFFDELEHNETTQS
ncbi:epoxyqueuosine reductase QueH [Staphylococcus simulans]|uniref:epoxyqueuosine reductase QueH n=1 Tax=Staphylococcus simulans TaxID=1286 RepID=UPI000D03C8C3|nr:epoxyqueuosine reductase QueH [Staphylococcus simulans]PTJ02483.1 DNA integration/recombination/inversion protein [Staphylococcus simulans]PTJ16048.1 DNA integration/recombination/inversion protein [Staphylococcus simulans]PTJ47563.1 DNA integration/recombination/inversion protein [Staphylococcus simulans]PTJ86124.1 DNA integration/recombination/inversion protein [Staphylococcus simulans]